MTLRLVREPSLNGGTLGSLYLDNRWVCWTLEDEIRERKGEPVARWKVPGRTAIPSGLYYVRVTWSPKFQRELPELRDVPGFTGIRIHSGNTPDDTSGCILVGFRRAHAIVEQSRPAERFLVEELQRSRDLVRIVIENPPVWE